MNIRTITIKLEKKARMLWPNCERWAVKVSVEAWSGRGGIHYSAHLMGFYKDPSAESESFSFKTNSAKGLFDEVNRKLDGLPKRMEVGLD